MVPWAAVIGDPIEHSLSPVLHLAAYEILGLDWEYRRYRVNTEELPAFMRQLDPDCKGLSVTMPCKVSVGANVDQVEGLAKLLRSSNTVVIAGGLRASFNTDVLGIVEALRPVLPVHLAEGFQYLGPPPVVIGTGATASSALAALASLGMRKVVLVGRQFAGPTNAFSIASRIGVTAEAIPIKLRENVASACAVAPIVISTVPPAVTKDISGLFLPDSEAVLLDVTYSDTHVPLATTFEQAGARVVSPLDMLTHQGIAQVKLMTNREVPFEPVHRAVVRAAEERDT